MRTPINRLLKSELVWLGNHYCKHHHTYLEHYACFIAEHPKDSPIAIPEVIGFLDIEASNLHATFGYIFSYCIKQLDDKLIARIITPADIRTGRFDKNLIKNFIEDSKEFDRMIVYWGKDRRYDVPFLRTRAVFWEHDFPTYRELFVTDVYDIVKAKLRLHRNKLQTACDFFDIPSKGHRLKPEIWQTAMAGDKKALDYILEHNKEDVYSLESLWKKLERFVRKSKTSI